MKKQSPDQYKLPFERGLISNWRPPRIADLPSWSGAKIVSFDTETCDPDLKTMGTGCIRPETSRMIGYSFCLDGGFRTYIPLSHVEDNVEDAEQALAYLQAQLAGFTGDLVGANIQYDLGYLLRHGIKWNPGCLIRDVQVAEPLIMELKSPGRMSNALGALGKRYGVGDKDDTLLNEAASLMGLNPKSEMYKIPARYVGPYAEQDVVLPLQIYALQKKTINQQGLNQIFDLESRVTPVLAKMRQLGVRVNQAKIDSFSTWAAGELRVQIAKIKYETGVDLSSSGTGDDHPLNSTKKLQPLIESIGYSCISNGKIAYPKTAMLVSTHPVAVALERARKLMKVETGFVGSTRRLMVNGRVHPTFNQLAMPREWEKNSGNDDAAEGGAAFGRLSCETPNMQNNPSRDDFADAWRDCYEPEEGAEWCSLDYSQQEPRIFATIAERMAIKRWQNSGDPEQQHAADVAIKAAEYYRNDPKADNHALFARLTGLERSKAKPVYLGVIYGMGGGKLASSLNLPQAYTVNYWHGSEQVVKFFPLDQQHEAEHYRHQIMEDRGWSNKPYKVWCLVGAGEAAHKILTDFHVGAPHIKMAKRTLEEYVKKHGFIPTLLNRHCHFALKKNGNGYDWLHKVLNRVVQGSAGDQSKQALVNMDAEGIIPHLQIHDEFCISIKNRNTALRVAELMRDSIPGLSVPFKVDIEIGPSWGQAEKWEY